MIDILEHFSPYFVALCTCVGVLYSNRVSSKATREGAELQDDLNWRKQFKEEIKELSNRIEALEEEVRIRGKRIGTLGDFLDALSMYLLYDKLGPFPDPPNDGAEEHYERGRYLLLKAKYESEAAAIQQRSQKQQ